MPVLHGEQHYGAKLTNQTVQLIRRTYEPGRVTYGQLAERFNVNKSTISRVIARTIWAHVPEQGEGV